MSKFCGNCGAMMNDTDRVCGACGTPFDAPVVPNAYPGSQLYDAYGNPVYTSVTPVKKFDFKKLVPIICGLLGTVAVVVIAVFAFNYASKAKYEKLIRNIYENLLEAMASGDADAYLDCLSCLDYKGNNWDEDAEEYAENYIDSYQDTLEENYGEIESINVDIESIKSLDKDEIEDLYDDYVSDEDDADLKLSDISAVKKIKLSIELVGSKDSDDSFKNKSIYIIKENGEWKMLSSSVLY